MWIVYPSSSRQDWLMLLTHTPHCHKQWKQDSISKRNNGSPGMKKILDILWRNITNQAELCSQTLIKETPTPVSTNPTKPQTPHRCEPIQNRLQVWGSVYVENLSIWNNLICSCQPNLIWENMSCQDVWSLCLSGLVHFQCHSTLF